jgi:hypothetical protein
MTQTTNQRTDMAEVLADEGRKHGALEPGVDGGVQGLQVVLDHPLQSGFLRVVAFK